MSIYSQVCWTDGMFLLIQHLQQLERSRDSRSSLLWQAAAPLGWGFLELQWNEAAVGQGQLELLRCRGIFPDGTPVDSPRVDPLPPPRSFKLEPDKNKLEVFLSLPSLQQRLPLSSAEGERADLRFLRKNEEIPDAHEPVRLREIELMVPNLRLSIGGEARDGLQCLKVGEIRRGSSGSPTLHAATLPPLLRVSGSSWLQERARELLGALNSKASSLKKHSPAGRAGIVELNSSEVLGFWFLHTLNQHIPAIENLVNGEATHPAALHEELLRLAGGLRSFSPGVEVRLPRYEHESIGAGFEAVDGAIRRLLGQVFQSPFEVIPLARQEEYHVGSITDPTLRDQGRFVLKVSADMPSHKLVEKFPSACKIASLEGIDRLVQTFVGGVTIQHLPNPPPTLPGPADAACFLIQSTGQGWEEVRSSSKLAIYVPRWLPNVKMSLIGVRPRS